jgi:2-dehydro-3-deoxygluconokinase
LARIVFVGEAMLELSRRGDSWHLGYGGDTLNTAIHLARAGHDVAFLTAIGSDALSADLGRKWEQAGLDTSLVLEHPTRSTGLYAISTDARGERSFSYWRDASAARDMFALPGIDPALKSAETADLLGFSLISLAILSPSARERLIALSAAVRTGGGRVAFDGNYRARLWHSAEEAARWRDRAVAGADIGLPTLDDERALGIATADAVAAHWQALGCKEVAVKLGEHGCRLPDGRVIAPEAIVRPIDTSGAGDAFNAGYLDARLNGKPPEGAARAGHRLARWTIIRPGAIPDVD